LAGQELSAPSVNHDIVLDGNSSDWEGISGITVPLEGQGGVNRVELKAVVRGDTIYMLAVWQDPTENILHKPYRWDEASAGYKKSKQMEDRFAVSFRMSGDFSHDKMGGSEFTADVWHWKASRSNPVGIAHDKMWKVSLTPFEKSKEWNTPEGRTIYLARSSDAGDRLYRPVRYDVKQDEIMNRYAVTPNPKGSIADVRAKGVWRDGRWVLEMSRKLDTGHDDDAVIPASGSMEIAVAAFDNVGSEKHSVSEIITLRTGVPGS
jgi:DMSO reductase family type II enzyme heme b subunit